MKILSTRYIPKSFIVKMSSSDKSSKKSLKQPKLTSLIRERSPQSSSADERPSKKIASSCSEAEADVKPPTTYLPSTSGAGVNPLNKIMKVNLASIFNPNIKEEGGKEEESELAKSIKEKRPRLYADITEFRFNKKRVRVLSEAGEISKESEGILYWMSRDQRVQG